MITIVPKYHRLGEGFSKREKAEADNHPGRKVGKQSGASWVCDLVDSNKCLLLCGWCRTKFNHKKNRYRVMYVADHTGHTSGYSANGMCDVCKQQTINSPGGGTAFIPEATYNQVCQDPMDARRKARARARSMTAWQAISRQRKQ